jgi:hypothetical protein
MIAARVLGAIEYMAEVYNVPLVEQAAAVATKLTVPKHIYKNTRYWKVHEKDALKHAVAYCYAMGVKE